MKTTQATITKYHRLGSLNNTTLFLTVWEAKRLRSRCCPILFLVRTLSWLANSFPVSSTMVERENKQTSGVSSYKGINPIMEGSTLTTSSKSHHPKAPSPTLSHWALGRHSSVHSKVYI